MPSANFGEKTNLDNRSFFVELKEKDDSIEFLIAGGGYYDGKHFMATEEGGWDIIDCPRIMEANPCDLCQKYFDLRKEAKDQEGDEKKATLKKARSFNAKITFFYPIVDLETDKPKVLKTVLSVRSQLESDHKKGLQVLGSAYELSRPEGEEDYYKLERLGVPKELSEETKTAYKEATEINLEELIVGKQSSQKFQDDVKEAVL